MKNLTVLKNQIIIYQEFPSKQTQSDLPLVQLDLAWVHPPEKRTSSHHIFFYNFERTWARIE